jgi:hypothetical protein
MGRRRRDPRRVGGGANQLPEPAEQATIGYYDLPSPRDMGTQKVEWDLEPGWVVSTLSGLSSYLPEIGRARSASGAPLNTDAPAAIAGGVGGFIALITASTPQDRVTGGISVLQNVAGLGSRLAELGSRAPVSVLAGRLGAASTLLGLGSLWWDAMTSGGAAIQAGVNSRELEGNRDGFSRGFAASLIGMDPESARAKLGLGPGSSDGLPSQQRAAQAYRDAYDASFWEGYEAGQELPDETAIAIVSEADRYATDRDVYLSPSRDAEVALVDALMRVLPLLRDELRAGTWEPLSEQLQAADAQALEAEAYAVSEAPSSAEQSQALDDALYPTSEAAAPEQQSQALDDAPASTSGSPATGQSQERDEPKPGGGVLLNAEDAPPTADPEPSQDHEPGWGVRLAPEERAQLERAETGGATTRAEAHREPDQPPAPPPTDHSDPPASQSGSDTDTTASQADNDSAADGEGSVTEAPAGGQATSTPAPETPSIAPDECPASTNRDEQDPPPDAPDDDAPPVAPEDDAPPPVEEPEQPYPTAGESTQTADDGDYPMPEPDPASAVDAPPEPEPQSAEQQAPAEEADGG